MPVTLTDEQDQVLKGILHRMDSRPHGQVVKTSHGVFEEVTYDRENAYDGLMQRAQLGNMMGSGLAVNGSGVLSRQPTIPQATIDAIAKSGIVRSEPYSGNNSGFTGYILEDGAKFIIPQLTPFRNMTPRVAMPGIDKINYRTVLDYFGGSGPSIATGVIDQGGTPNQLSYNFKDLNYTAKMIGVADVVPFETQIYGRSFQGDVLATASAKLIPALMQVEELWLLNGGANLWTPPPIQATTAITGGTLASTNPYWFIVTAINANGTTLGTTMQGPFTIASGSTGSITLTIFTVPEAVSYGVYAATSAAAPAAGAMWLQSATTNFGSASALNQPTANGVKQGYFTATLTSLTTSGTAYSTVTTNTSIRYKSTNASNLNAPLTFDGAQALIYNNAGAGSTLGIGGETPLVIQPASTVGTLALTDIDTLHLNMFLNSHADPDYLFAGVVDHKKLSYIVSQGTNARILLDSNNADAQGHLVAGYRATAYINQTTGKVIPITTLPYFTQGTIMFGTYQLPFQVQNIAEQPFHVGYNRDMWSQVYPPDQSHPTQTMVADYLNECLVNQCLGFWSIINGITIS